MNPMNPMDFQSLGMPMNLNTNSSKYAMNPQAQGYKKKNYVQQNNPNFPPQPLPKKPQKVFQDYYKTQMCPQLPMGTCYKGENCTYAHSEQDLRKKPDLSKTKLCEAFMKGGSCINGDKCMFAHGSYELKSTPDFFKTALCYSFKNSGICQAGDKCRYAHGDDELKQRNAMGGGMPSMGGMMKNKPFDYMMSRDGNSIENYFPQMYPTSQMMSNYMGPSSQSNMKVNMGGMGMMNESGDFGFNNSGMGGNNMGFMQGPGGVPSFDGFKYNPYPYEDKK